MRNNILSRKTWKLGGLKATKNQRRKKVMLNELTKTIEEIWQMKLKEEAEKKD